MRPQSGLYGWHWSTPSAVLKPTSLAVQQAVHRTPGRRVQWAGYRRHIWDRIPPCAVYRTAGSVAQQPAGGSATVALVLLELAGPAALARPGPWRRWSAWVNVSRTTTRAMRKAGCEARSPVNSAARRSCTNLTRKTN